MSKDVEVVQKGQTIKKTLLYAETCGGLEA